MSLLTRSLAFCFLLTLMVFAFVFNAMNWVGLEKLLHTLPYRCPLKLITGLECAFCGMTHSWIALLRGEWMEGYHYNALGPLLFLSAIGAALATVAGVNLKKRFKPWMGISAIVVLLIYAVVRNIH